MRTGIAVAIVAVSILGSSPAKPACLPGQSPNCVNLDFLPQISRQIVAGERLAAPREVLAPASEPQLPYNGLTVGVSPTVRHTPTVGYHWSLD